MEIKQIKTSKLIPYARNNKIHDEYQIKKIASSLKEFGWKQPVVIDKDNVIIAGHGRVAGAELIGEEYVPCIIADDLTETQIKAYRIADNKLSAIAEWDNEMLSLELEDLVGEIDFDTMGFDIEEAEELMNVLEGSLEEKGKEKEKDLSDEVKESFEIVIELENEQQQEELYEELSERGLICRVLTL